MIHLLFRNHQRAVDLTARVAFMLALGSLACAELSNQIWGLGVAPHAFVGSLLVRDGQLVSSLLGVFVVALLTARVHGRSRGEVAALLLASLLMEGLMGWYRQSVLGMPAPIRYTPDWYGAGAGLVALAYLLLDIVRSAPGEARRHATTQALLAWHVPILLLASTSWHVITVRGTPVVYDAHGYLADMSFSTPLSFAVAAFVRRFVALRHLVEFNYVLLAPFLVVFGFLWAERPARFRVNFVTFKLMVGLGSALYFILPMVGTDVMFGDRFPDHPPRLTITQPPPYAANMGPGFPRNSIPSLHIAWALVLYWSLARRNTWQARLVLFFLGVTVLSTLNYGHYFIDLVVALPFTLGCRSSADGQCSRGLRVAGIVGGFGLTLAWLLGLRYHADLCWRFPLASALAQVATVVGVIAFERRLGPAEVNVLLSPSQNPQVVA